MPVVIDDGNNRLAAVMQFIQQQQQKRAEAERMRVQQEQFDKTYQLQQQTTAAQVGRDTAETERSKYLVSSDESKRAAEQVKKNYEILVANGKPAEASAYVRGEIERRGNDPQFATELFGYAGDRPVTDLDTTNANLAGIKRSASEAVLGGKGTAQDFGFTYNMATGENPAAYQYNDALQREAGPAAHAQYSAIAGDRAPGAQVELQARTQTNIAGMQISSAERMAKERLNAPPDQMDLARDERGLRADFRKDYGKFIEADKMLEQAEAYAAQGTGSGDQMLLIAALSAIDGSVTREGEVALARRTAGLPQRMRQKLANWKEGDLLDPTTRANIINAAREARALSQPRRQEVLGYYTKLANDYGMSPERIIGLAGHGAGGPRPGDTKRAANGRMLRFDGTGWTDASGTSGSW